MDEDLEGQLRLSLPDFIAAKTLRMSLEIPEIPSSPDSSLSNSIETAARQSHPLASGKSGCPDRPIRTLVPIMSPSRGVKPIVVSTLRPPAIAASEQPLPRWQDTSRSSASGFPSN